MNRKAAYRPKKSTGRPPATGRETFKQTFPRAMTFGKAGRSPAKGRR